ncbi:MAG TPA: hypothetical protein DEH78_25665 [Solibacterales bacterium]|nr:hypothetical protein [Bryobacterales bacterium]
MRWLTLLRKRLRSILRRESQEQDLAREFEIHLDQLTRELAASGLSAADARREALRQFGPSEVLKEECRDMRRVTFLEDLFRDSVFSLRLLRKSPGFAATAVLSLVMGIGANTAMFQLFEAVLLRSLPVERPDELMIVRIRGEGHSGSFRGRNGHFSYALWDALRREQRPFGGLLAYGDTPINLAAAGELRNVDGLWVSGSFFPMLGVRPYLGRLLTPEDDKPGCGQVGVVLSHAFWQREFGGDAQVLSRKLPIEGRSMPILGVTPPEFFGVEVGRRFDVAVPICAAPEDMTRDRRFFFLSVMARLKPGIGEDAARGQLRSVSASIFDATVPPDDPASHASYRQLQLDVIPGAAGQSEFREDLSRPLTLLVGVVALVLLLACTNLANMMLARASAREHEFAVRRSLGASRSRLMRQVLVESLLLAVPGAVLGALAAPLLGRALLSILSTARDPLYLTLDRDWRVMATAIAAAVVATLLFGVAPALRAGRAEARGSSANRETFVFRRVLLGTQAAFSMVLLTAALLFSSSFRNLMTASPGFDPEGILVAHVFLNGRTYPPERRAAAIADLHERVAAIPGVVTSARSYVIPIGGSSWDRSVYANRSDPPKAANLTSVSEGYFRTMKVPMLAGRDFNKDDRPTSTPVAVVNQALVRALFDGKDSLGKTIWLGGPEPPVEIVGVVGDSKYRTLGESFTPIVYLAASQEQRPRTTLRFLLRTSSDPGRLIPSVKQTVAGFDQGLFMRFSVLETQLQESILREKLMAVLFGGFGLLGGMLALTGVFGVTAYIVSRRHREFGVRIALGATRTGIVRLVLREIAGAMMVGILLGGFLVIAAGSATAALLYGIKPYDTAILLAVALLLAGGGLSAALLPALRASGVAPVTALRMD